MADIPLLRFHSLTKEGKSGTPEDKSVFIVAGQHGWEYTGVLTAFNLAHELGCHVINDEIAILPVSNPVATAAATRLNPIDGQNLNAHYDSVLDAGGAVSGGGDDALGIPWLSCSLRRMILRTALGYSRVIDLHSAGQARYLSHVIVTRESEIDEARHLGLPFVIKRPRGKEGIETTLVAAVCASGRRAFAVELGAGTAVRKEDVDTGVRALVRYLASIGAIDGSGVSASPAPECRVFTEDVRCIVKAERLGLVCHEKALGEIVIEGEVIANILSLADWKHTLIRSPVSGRIIYQRDYSLIGAGETIAMIIPDFSKANEL